MPDTWVHAVIHVIVENQLAMGIAAVESALERMLAEGLNRHEAIHAIGSVLIGEINDGVRDNKGGDLTPAYYEALSELTAAKWRSLA